MDRDLRPARPRAGASLAAIVWVLIFAPGPPAGNAARIAQAAPAQAALNEMLSRAAGAANSRDPGRMQPFVSGDASRLFAWVRSRTSVWQAGALTVPQAGNGAPESPALQFAVFHAWHTCESDGDHIHRLVDTPDGWRLGAEIPETETGGYRIRDHNLHVAVDFSTARVSITDHMRVAAEAGEGLGCCLLRLSQDFTLRSLAYDEQPVGAGPSPIPFQQVGGIIAFVPAAKPVFDLYLRYDGVVRHQVSDYVRDDEVTLDSYWYPHIARLPVTSTVTVTAPPGWTAVGPGELVSRAQAANGTTFVFRNALPVSFLTLDVGRYSATTRVVNGITLSTYLLRQDPSLAGRCLDLLSQAMGFYESKFGKFPYTRYGVVQTDGPFQGALEAYAFATFGPNTLPGTIPHELSHTWWGGMVPCTYTKSMWDESFADYSDDLFRRSEPGGRDGRLGSRLRAGAASLIPANEAAQMSSYALDNASDTSDGPQSAVGYGKGAMVLRVLEEELGQSLMMRCMAEFARSHPRGQPAEWPELEAVVNRVTGKDYDWFFAQWIRRAGLPELRLSGVHATAEETGARVDGDLVQTGPIYRLSVPVLCLARNGARVTTIVRTRDAVTHFVVQVPAPPRLVCLDPDDVLPLAAASRADLNVVEHQFASPGPSADTSGPDTAPEPPRAIGSLNVFLDRLAAAARGSDPAAFRDLAAPGVILDASWVGKQPVTEELDPDHAAPWSVAVLPAPEAGASHGLVVLSRYHPCESQGDHVYLLDQVGDTWRLGREIAERNTLGLRFLAHDVRIRLIPAAGSLVADDRITAQRESHPQDALGDSGLALIRLQNGYHVDAVRSGSHGVWFRQSGGIIAVRLPPGPAAATDRMSLEILYHGRAAQNEEDFITPAEAVLTGYWLPHIARLPVTLDVTATVPRGWQVFTQGVRVGAGKRAGTDTETFAYRDALAICYPSLDAGPFHVLEAPRQRGEAWQVRAAYLRPADRAVAQKALDTAGAALRFYSSAFSRFPFPDYTVVISDRFVMALEGYSMVTIARSYVPVVLPHEIAHTWWGGIVPNTYLRDMWDEAFAEYSDGLYARVTGRSDSMHQREMRALRFSGQLATATIPLLDARDALDDQQSLVGYMKGSWVLETLEQMLGRARMLSCMRVLLARRRPGADAGWSDFVSAVADEAGNRWRAFFNAWLPSSQLPAVGIAGVHESTAGAERAVTAQIVQSGAFWLSVPVQLRLATGATVRRRVNVTSRDTPIRFTIPAGTAPVELAVDPERTVLRRDADAPGAGAFTAPTTYRFPAGQAGKP